MKIGKQTFKLETKPSIEYTSSIVGPKEMQGPLKDFFDTHIEDVWDSEKSFEKCESKMLKTSINNLMQKADIKDEDVDLIFSGDLLNQCISSDFAIRSFQIPFLGLFGACSTFCEGMILASMLLESKLVQKIICGASSHFCSAERQFRMPLEHGNQRSTTSQATVTGAGSVLITNNKNVKTKITYVTPGKIQDLGVKDMANMGAAMAPAAFNTIAQHLIDTNRDIDYYDAIITGDLGTHGSQMLCKLFKLQNIDIESKHIDCGSIIYDLKTQDVNCGGSGCGCIASVFSSYIYKKIQDGEYNKILLVATGALMSPISSGQGESIPSIAHAVAIENEV